jgi:hypothetical protein
MSTQQSIFLKMIYAYTNSKRFINIQPYTVLAKAGEGEGFYNPIKPFLF